MNGQCPGMTVVKDPPNIPGLVGKTGKVKSMYRDLHPGLPSKGWATWIPGAVHVILDLDDCQGIYMLPRNCVEFTEVGVEDTKQ